MLVQAALNTTTVWTHAGQILTASVVTLTALWAVLVTIGKPLLDNAWLGSFRRKRTDIEAIFRQEIFKPDLETAESTRETVRRVTAIANGAAKSIEGLQKQHADIDRELRALPALVQAVESCTAAVETFTRDLGAVSGRLERFGGMLDVIRQSSSSSS